MKNYCNKKEIFDIEAEAYPLLSVITAVVRNIESSSEGMDRAFAAGLSRLPVNLSDNRCIGYSGDNPVSP
jgi:hypothetical protein